MTDTFTKLNYKDQNPILILNAPREFGEEIKAISKIAKVDPKPSSGDGYAFCIGFAEKRADLLEAVKLVKARVNADSVIWFAYPKQTSKKYSSDLNRDICRETLDTLGFRTVRQVSIDEDWSALRYKIS
jgi:hypothetical protein